MISFFKKTITFFLIVSAANRLNAQATHHMGIGLYYNRIPQNYTKDGSYRYWSQTTIYPKNYICLNITHDKKFKRTNFGVQSTLLVQPTKTLIIEDGFENYDNYSPIANDLRVIQVYRTNLNEIYLNFSKGLYLRGKKSCAPIISLGYILNNSIRSKATKIRYDELYHYDTLSGWVYDTTLQEQSVSRSAFFLTHWGIYAQAGLFFESKKGWANSLVFQVQNTFTLYRPFEFTVPNVGWAFSVNYTAYIRLIPKDKKGTKEESL